MGIVEDQFAELQENGSRRKLYSKATITTIPNGTYLVKLEGFVLPSGWN